MNSGNWTPEAAEWFARQIDRRIADAHIIIGKRKGKQDGAAISAEERATFVAWFTARAYPRYVHWQIDEPEVFVPGGAPLLNTAGDLVGADAPGWVILWDAVLGDADDALAAVGELEYAIERATSTEAEPNVPVEAAAYRLLTTDAALRLSNTVKRIRTHGPRQCKACGNSFRPERPNLKRCATCRGRQP